MPDPPHSALSPEEARYLYQRLLDRDPLAPAPFAAAFLEPLTAWLQSTYPPADPAACNEAAADAIVHFLKNLTRYDPERLELEPFLRLAARRDLLNVLRKEQRHQKNRRDWKIVVEQAPDDGKYLCREDDPSLPLQIEEARREQVPPAVWRRMTDVERRVWQVMQQGEHSDSVFAAILGVTHLPADEQKSEVKRVKDRLKARMKRAGGKRGRSP